MSSITAVLKNVSTIVSKGQRSQSTKAVSVKTLQQLFTADSREHYVSDFTNNITTDNTIYKNHKNL